MNRSSNSSLTKLLCVAFIAAALLPTAYGQAGGSGSSGSGNSSSGTVTKYDILIANGVVNFPGGGRDEATLDTVIDHVFRARFPHANFALAPGLGKIEVGDLKLANLAGSGQPSPNIIVTALEAVRLATGNAFTFRAEWPTPDVPNSGMYYLEASQQPATKKTVAAFNLSRLGQDANALNEELHKAYLELNNKRAALGPNNPEVKQAESEIEILQRANVDGAEEKAKLIDQIQTQVKRTLDTLHLPDSPEFDYNSSMHLLVVVGTEDQIDVTRTILDAVVGNPAPPRQKLRKDLMNLDDLPVPQPNPTPQKPK